MSSGPTPSPARHATVFVIRSSFTHFVGTRFSAHYSCDSVDVCGVQGRVSEISPLTGENENDDDDEHPEHADEPRERQAELESAYRTSQGHPSVPTDPWHVKLQKGKLLLSLQLTILLKAMDRRSSLILQLGSILPR
jgi:hypothetical protein